MSDESPVAFGHPHRHFAVCESTNIIGRELAAAGAPSGTVVTAGEQTEGRGRQGRTWAATRDKALLYSAVFRPLEARHRVLPLAVPLAVCDAVEALGGGPCKVKWPNDVWVEGRKCSGILIEARPQDGWAVIGVGLNVAIERDEFPIELRDTATSIGGGATVPLALEALNAALGNWVAAEPGHVLESFRNRDALAGSEIRWADGEGVAHGVDDAGNLVVETGDGTSVALGAGEVHLSLRPDLP